MHRSLREEVLDVYLFEHLDEVRETAHHWLINYNERRPHESLGRLPPALYRQQLKAKPSLQGETSAAFPFIRGQ